MSGRSNASNEKSASAYWELVKLIFTAFYLDHSQNTFLGNYFTLNLQQNISNFKVALDIVQSLLSNADLTTGKNENDSSAFLK